MNDRGFGGLPVTGWLALVLAVVGVIVWKQAPLDPKRNTTGEVSGVQVRALQDVNARLWEDPFSAVARYKRESAAAKPAVPAGNGGKDADALRSLQTVCEKLVAGTAKGGLRLHVLATMVSNAPYSDGEERRRRTRYAVESALSVAHFVPENADHLGFFTGPSGSDVPFEAFRRKNAGKEKLIALVLWLEDEVFSWADTSDARVQSLDDRPLGRLAKLRDDVKRHCVPAALASDSAAFSFSVLGPANSQTLRTMTRELQRLSDLRANDPAAPAPFGEPFDIYSAFATAPAKEILGEGKPRKAAGRASGSEESCRDSLDESYCRLRVLFWENGLRFYRAIATDNAAAEALVDELERRAVPVRTAVARASTRHHVAIVSEWDTYYGRRLPAVFLRAAGLESACETDPSEVDAATRASPAFAQECRVMRFSYLRGLDGEGPRTANVAAKEASTRTTEKLLRAPTAEPAEGLSQFDYLRRLAVRIRNEDARLKREHRGEIGAIGVLGSDVYDKIAILRALKPAFPGVIFFTTDLDARLLEAEHLEWTRNLIVASGYGFELAPCLQKDVPPFRGTYQTAAYLGARVALFNALPTGSILREDLCPEDRYHQSLRIGGQAADAAGGLSRISAEVLDRWMARPRLFELGRTSAVTLDDTRGHCAGLARCGNIHPDDRALREGKRAFGWGLALIGLAFALLLLARSTRQIVLRPAGLAMHTLHRGTGPERAGALILLLAVVAPPVWVVTRALTSIDDPFGEPFYWAEGVSLWPSELIRLGALMLGLCFLVYLFSELDRGARDLAREFDLTPTADVRPLWRVALGRFSADPGMPRRAAVLWAEYVNSGHLVWRLLRTFAWVAAFGLFAAVLFENTAYPNNPGRGDAALQVEYVLRVALVALFLFLLFAVNDAIRLCGRLINELTASREGNDWSRDLCLTYAARLGLQDKLGAAPRDTVLDAWIDTRFVARFTAKIGALLYFPFLLLALIIVARWSAFDSWDFTPGLVVVLSLTFVLACFNAVQMQRAASRARRSAVSRLNDLVIRANGGADPDYPGSQMLQALVKSIQDLREGAFVPFVDQPLVRAVLIPFSSAGGLYLVDLFALAT